jgi:acid phosphatase (class A)
MTLDSRSATRWGAQRGLQQASPRSWPTTIHLGRALALLGTGLIAFGLAAPTAVLPPGAIAVEPSAARGLRLDDAELRRVTGSPPAPGSAEASEDLAILLWLQYYRTPEMEAASWLLIDRNISGFSRALGNDLGSGNPILLEGLGDFLAPVVRINTAIKREVGRVRPYLSYTELHNCLPREATPSFPSSHATWFRAMGELMADLVPDRRERLRQVGLQGGANRVLCGVHYPSDVAAGQRLGAEAARQIIASPQWRAFRQDPRLQQELGRLRNVPDGQLPMLVR